MVLNVLLDTHALQLCLLDDHTEVEWLWPGLDRTAVDSVPVDARAMLPSSSAISITLGAGVRMVTFVNTTPIDANRAINRFCLIRNFAGWDGFDDYARSAMYKILSEDKVRLLDGLC